MRFCGDFGLSQKLARTENRPETDGVARQRVGAALLAVDHADGSSHQQTRLAERFDALEQRAPGRDDVLDEADAFALVVDALEAVRGRVLLRRLADDQE